MNICVGVGEGEGVGVLTGVLVGVTLGVVFDGGTVPVEQAVISVTKRQTTIPQYARFDFFMAPSNPYKNRKIYSYDYTIV